MVQLVQQVLMAVQAQLVQPAQLALLEVQEPLALTELQGQLVLMEALEQLVSMAQQVQLVLMEALELLV
jgi:hypothetical protein